MPDNTQYAYRYGERRKSGRNRLSLTYSPLWGGGKANCLAGAGRHEWPRRLFRRGTWSMGGRWSSRDGLYRGDPSPVVYGPVGISAAAMWRIKVASGQAAAKARRTRDAARRASKAAGEWC